MHREIQNFRFQILCAVSVPSVSAVVNLLPGTHSTENVTEVAASTCFARGRAQVSQQAPAQQRRHEQADGRPGEVAEEASQFLDAVAEELAEQDVDCDPQRLAREVVEEEARPT